MAVGTHQVLIDNAVTGGKEGQHVFDEVLLLRLKRNEIQLVVQLVVHRRRQIGGGSQVLIRLGCQNQRLTVYTVNFHLPIALDK